MAEGFVLHLGGGLYVDGAGRITTVPQIPDTQSYRPAGTLTFEADKLIARGHHGTPGRRQPAWGAPLTQGLRVEARIPKFVQMQSEIHPLGAAISKLITHDWSPLFRLDDYKEIHSLSPLLFTRKTDGSFTPFHLTAPVRRFDYRLGVPIFAYTATAYPLLVSAGLPWYRSAGSHALRLRELANAIGAFATRMYSECLARTIHTAQSMFQWEGCVPLFNFLPGVPSMPPARRRVTPRDEYLVGAVDLVRYTDGWLADEFGLAVPRSRWMTLRLGKPTSRRRSTSRICRWQAA